MSVVGQAKGRLRSVPLRIKLVASVLALVAAALVVISLLTAFFLQSYLVGRVDSELDSYLDRAQQSMPSDATASSLPSDYMVVTASRSTGRGQIVYDKSLVPEDLPGSLNQFSPGTSSTPASRRSPPTPRTSTCAGG